MKNDRITNYLGFNLSVFKEIRKNSTLKRNMPSIYVKILSLPQSSDVILAMSLAVSGPTFSFV